MLETMNRPPMDCRDRDERCDGIIVHVSTFQLSDRPLRSPLPSLSDSALNRMPPEGQMLS